MSPPRPLDAQEPAPGIGPHPLHLADVHAAAQRIVGNVERVLVGKPDAVRTALITLLAEGHLLVEDVPELGRPRWPRR